MITGPHLYFLMTPHAPGMNHGSFLSLPPYYFISNSISVSTVIAALDETLLEEELAKPVVVWQQKDREEATGNRRAV